MITVMRAPQRGQTYWQGAVKIQKSIKPEGEVLIYNERRTILYNAPMPPELAAMFFPGELKFYADATYRNGELTINARNNQPQEW